MNWEKKFKFIPAKLRALKKQLVINEIALVSSPKLLRKSPNIKPSDGIDPTATAFFLIIQLILFP